MRTAVSPASCPTTTKLFLGFVTDRTETSSRITRGFPVAGSHTRTVESPHTRTGSIEDGRLVCPWHQSAYDVENGQMVRGPQQIFAKIPGLGTTFKMLTKVWPLGRGTVSVSGNDIVVE